MEIAFFIQFGYLGETWEDICLTRKLIKECLPADIGISVSYPLPGTKFYNIVHSTLGDKRNWADSDDLDLIFPGTYPRQFYKYLHRFVHAEYNLCKIFKKRLLKKGPHTILFLFRYVYYRIKLQKFLHNSLNASKRSNSLIALKI
jgi:radical SAM superfamily enzyme YgiQ (UPF0313 family)